MCKVGEINLSYECLTSPEIRQTLAGLRDTDSVLFKKPSIPSSSGPVPPPCPEHGGSYPEDRENEDSGGAIDSSLSIDEVVAQMTDKRLGEQADSSGDEDEGIDGFCHEDPHVPARTLEPFDARMSTSYWPLWDGHSTVL